MARRAVHFGVLAALTLVGTYTVDGRKKEAPSGDQCEITSIEKIGNHLWRFNAGMDCCGLAGKGSIPIVVPMRWVEDTPVIMMTDTSHPEAGFGRIPEASSSASLQPPLNLPLPSGRESIRAKGDPIEPSVHVPVQDVPRLGISKRRCNIRCLGRRLLLKKPGYRDGPLTVDGHETSSPVRAPEVRVTNPPGELPEQALPPRLRLAGSILAGIETDLDAAVFVLRVDHHQSQAQHSQQLDDVPSSAVQRVALLRDSDVDLRRQRQPFDGLQHDAEVERALELDDDGSFLPAYCHDVTVVDFSLHVVVLSFQKPLQGQIEIGFLHAVTSRSQIFVSRPSPTSTLAPPTLTSVIASGVPAILMCTRLGRFIFTPWWLTIPPARSGATRP
jgi:hypothetical protein